METPAERIKRLPSKRFLRRIFNEVDRNNENMVSYKDLYDRIKREDATDSFHKGFLDFLREKASRGNDANTSFEDFAETVNTTRYKNRWEKYLNTYMKILLPPVTKHATPYSTARVPHHSAPTTPLDESTQTPMTRRRAFGAMRSLSTPARSLSVSNYRLEYPEVCRSKVLGEKIVPIDEEKPEDVDLVKPAYISLALDLEEEPIRSIDVVDSFPGKVSEEQLFLVKRGSIEDVEEDYLDDHIYNCCPPKLGMLIVSMLEILLFLIDNNLDNGWVRGGVSSWLVFDPARRWEAWRFLTYMLVHTGAWHLSVNVLIQLLLGIPLEMAHNWWRVLLVYSCGVIAGSLGSSVANSRALLAGASGGVYALITAHVISVLVNWKRMNYPVPQILAFLVIICTDLSVNVINASSMSSDRSISHVAHFFGGSAGLLVAASVLGSCYALGKCEKIAGSVSLGICVALSAAAVLYNIIVI